MRLLSGGAIKESLYDMLKGDKPPEIDADAARERILKEFDRLGGANS